MFKLLVTSLLLCAIALPAQTWKVWYDDGSGLQIFHSDLHSWADIPSAPGIQVILTCEPPPNPGGNVRHVPRRQVKGSNWYWLDAQGIPQQSKVNGKPDGFPNTPLDNPPPEAQGHNPRGGVTIDDEVYEGYRRMAVRDFRCEKP